MASFWQYYLVNKNSWNSVFGKANEDTERIVIGTAAEYETSIEYDQYKTELDYLNAVAASASEEIKSIASNVCKNGISYESLSETQAITLDRIIMNCLSPEHSIDLLKPIAVHNNGIRSFVLEELLLRGQDKKIGGFLGFGAKISKGLNTSLVKYVVHGRRVNSETIPHPSETYFLFSQSEVSTALKEVQGLMNINRPWSHPDIEVAIKGELIQALEAAKREDTWLAGCYFG